MNGLDAHGYEDPERLFGANLCLHRLSKDVEGTMHPISARSEKCPERGCRVLKTGHRLELKLGTHQPCDSDEALALSGDLHVVDLVSAFVDGEGVERGVHTGRVHWQGAVVATGAWSGVTNVGTHREPAFKSCQSCDERGVMEGRLCAVVHDKTSPLWGWRVVAAYRLAFSPSAQGGEGPVTGTIEGLLVGECH